jgi:hypothetical protein
MEVCAGLIKNLTIIEDHASPLASDDASWGGDYNFNWERAYTIHVEGGTNSENERMIIEDCIIKNTKRAALGMGTYQGMELIVRNCDIWSGTPTRTPIEDFRRGAAYFHNRQAAATDQKIRFINNTIHCDDTVALFILDSIPGTASLLDCEFVNNMIYSVGSGKTDSTVALNGGAFGTNITLSAKSYGNNIAVLNA